MAGWLKVAGIAVGAIVFMLGLWLLVVALLRFVWARWISKDIDDEEAQESRVISYRPTADRDSLVALSRATKDLIDGWTETFGSFRVKGFEEAILHSLGRTIEQVLRIEEATAFSKDLGYETTEVRRSVINFWRAAEPIKYLVDLRKGTPGQMYAAALWFSDHAEPSDVAALEQVIGTIRTEEIIELLVTGIAHAEALAGSHSPISN